MANTRPCRLPRHETRHSATLAAVADDKDPAAEKKQERAKAQHARLDTLSVLADRYFIDAVKGRHRHGGRAKREEHPRARGLLLEEAYQPAFGSRAIRTVTRAEIQAFVNGFDAPSTARQCRVVFQRLFTFARWLELVDVDPSRFVQVDSFKPRDRVLTDDELRAIWRAFAQPSAVDGVSVSRAVSLAVRLIAVTLQRRAEVIGIDTRELDLDAMTWTIPAERTKNHRTHVVPLSGIAAELIKQALADRGRTWCRPLFPSPRLRRQADIAECHHPCLPASLQGTGAEECEPPRFKADGSHRPDERASRHPRFIVSRVLNHASDTGDAAAVTAVYDRHAYLPESGKHWTPGQPFSVRLSPARRVRRTWSSSVGGTRAREWAPVPWRTGSEGGPISVYAGTLVWPRSAAALEPGPSCRQASSP